MVAVKILGERSGQLTADKGQRLLGRPRLLEEATKARRVDHPNVVRVLDRGVADDDSAFIVYELVEGGDLDHWIHARTAPVPVREAARMVACIARGVQAAHSAGLVHCDLKPGNVILTPVGEPKVADFGIAVRFGQSRPGEYDVEALDANHPIGNVAFISPEQYRMDEGALTVPADIYALGGILYMLLTGRLPNGSTLKEIARTHDREKGRQAPPQLRTHRPEVDRDLEAICHRAMAIRAEDRYSSAGTLADDLEAWLRLEPLSWTKPSALHVLRLWIRRRPAVASSWALLITSILAGVFAVTHYSRQAAAAEIDRAQAQMEAEIARVRQAEAAAREASIHDIVNEFRSRLAGLAARGDRTAAEIFSSLWSMEHIFVPTVIDAHSDGDEFQRVRFEAVQAAVGQAVRDGRENDLDALLWRSLLAFWMVGAGDVEEAWPMLEELEARWDELLAPSDHWLQYFRAIKASAVVKRLERKASTKGLEGDDRDDLQNAASFLLRQEQTIRMHDPRSPVHHLVLHALTLAFQPELLDDSQQLDHVQAMLDELGIRQHFPRRR